jgi:hypothetical protein
MARLKGNRQELELRKVRFCPWCGVANLTRDDQFNPAGKNPCPSFLCNACNRGFIVSPSPRVQYAQRMIADERRNKY